MRQFPFTEPKWAALAHARKMQGKNELALNYFDRALAEVEDDGTLLLAKALCAKDDAVMHQAFRQLAVSGNWATAQKLCTSYNNKGYPLAYICWMRRDVVACLESLAHLEDPAARILRSRALIALGREAEATTELETVLEQDRTHGIALDLYFQILVKDPHKQVVCHNADPNRTRHWPWRSSGANAGPRTCATREPWWIWSRCSHR